MNAVFNQIAHGRVNLIGEHTDYNGGWVLPTLIPQFTQVRLAPNGSRSVRGRTQTLTDDDITLEYQIGREAKTGRWIDYVQGATRCLTERGFDVTGFDVEVSSTVPMGSGLSSSAALEIALLKAVREAFGFEISDVEIAKVGQQIENEFVGARVGIMDQMACSLARAGEALFLDTKTLEFERLPLPMEQVDLVVINSGVAHRNSGGGYNQRRSECEEASRLLGVSLLREIEAGDEKIERLPDILRRRARHVVTENRRVHLATEALRARDMVELGRLFHESHRSMRDDFEVSIPEIDLLVELCLTQLNVFGARLTGGGFGGSIVAIAKKGTGLSAARWVVSKYEVETGIRATILV